MSNIEDGSNCSLAFFLSKPRSNLCLSMLHDKPESSTFEWKTCTYNNKAQRWVKLASNEKPGMAQICHDGQKKCLIASSQTSERPNYSVMLTKYKKTAEVASAQLWKMNKKTGQLTNVQYSSSCLAEMPNIMNHATLSLITKECEGSENSSFETQWDFKPIVDKDLKCIDLKSWETSLSKGI